MPRSRHPAVAGAFYPEDARSLRAELHALLDGLPDEGPPPRALIVPHAGYVYSGAVAALAYARLRPLAGRIRRVVLFGPAHRVPVDGMALPSVDFFETPLGPVPLDREAVEECSRLRGVSIDDRAHAWEHSLEVQLPFLQVLLDDFRLLPVLVGDADPEDVASLMEVYVAGDENLLLVSSDLSHFLDYDAARRMDGETREAIEALDAEDWPWERACGRIPILGLLRLARRLNLHADTLALCNSGDAAGDRDRVVGYGAWLFRERTQDDGDHDA